MVLPCETRRATCRYPFLSMLPGNTIKGEIEARGIAVNRRLTMTQAL